MRNANFGNLEQIYTNKQYFEQLKSDKSKLYWYGKSKPRGNTWSSLEFYFIQELHYVISTHTQNHTYTHVLAHAYA